MGAGDFTYFGLADWPRNYLAVTGACIAVAAQKFDQVGGFDDRFHTAGSDVKFCLDLYGSGYRNIYWPFAKLVHYENVSVGVYNQRHDTQQDQTRQHKAAPKRARQRFMHPKPPRQSNDQGDLSKFRWLHTQPFDAQAFQTDPALRPIDLHANHRDIAEGQQHELAALKLSSDKLQKQTAAQTAELQAKATMAEQAYDKEINSLNNLSPVSVRVCSYTPAHSGSVVPKAGTAQSRDAAPGATSGDVLEVPPRDSGERDIGGLLSILAARADEVSATLREYQSR